MACEKRLRSLYKERSRCCEIWMVLTGEKDDATHQTIVPFTVRQRPKFWVGRHIYQYLSKLRIWPTDRVNAHAPSVMFCIIKW